MRSCLMSLWWTWRKLSVRGWILQWHMRAGVDERAVDSLLCAHEGAVWEGHWIAGGYQERVLIVFIKSFYSYTCFLWRTEIAKISSFSSCIWYNIRYFPNLQDHKFLSFPFNCFPACGFSFKSLRPQTTLSCNVFSSREKSLSNLCDKRRLYFILSKEELR